MTFRYTVLLALCLLAGMVRAGAEDAAEQPVESWRTRYELGPGDVVNFAFYGRPELDRNGIRIAPDGTISYLQATNVNISGLTLGEAREKIEERLRKYFRDVRVIVTPEELASKRYTVMGKVMKRGVYTLERPLTLVEAVARAGGTEVGLFEQNTVELADMERSFIVRGDEKLPVDFQKLFLEGDLAQNVQIEPNDYIYLASNVTNEYYVFGAVGQPGVQSFTPNATIVTALSRRLGFGNKARFDRVIVVRGSLEHPEIFDVNVGDILTGKQKDFRLKPKDIIYVPRRPTAEAEELADLAIRAFITSAAVNYVDLHTPHIFSP
ncbi:MAG: polysaccharide biosynthesis/export family protein [Puniceicoccales bacterium]